MPLPTRPSGPPPTPASHITVHMNADHADSTLRYLEHHHALPSSLARRATLTDITLTHLTFAVPCAPQPLSLLPLPAALLPNQTYRIPLDPPLSSLADARARLVAMDADSARALGRDALTLKKYLPPDRPHQYVIILLVAGTLLLYASPRPTLPYPQNQTILRGLARRFPAFFAFAHAVRVWILWLILVIHTGECVGMDLRRLRGLSVARGSGVWWAWMAGTFFGGVGTFERLDGWMREERGRKGKGH